MSDVFKTSVTSWNRRGREENYRRVNRAPGTVHTSSNRLASVHCVSVVATDKKAFVRDSKLKKGLLKSIDSKQK